MKVIIRPIEKEDDKAIAQIIRTVFDEHQAPQYDTVYSDPTTDNLFNVFEKPKSCLWVGEIGNKIVGCCGIYPTKGLPENCAELVKFYLASNARGKGVGKQLMQKCFHSAKQFGYTQLYLESLPQFAKAISMYQKYEFVKLARPLGNSGHTSCNIWMLKQL